MESKAIALDGAGRTVSFEMNDRCAAGAGRFLEMIAAALQYNIQEFGSEALTGRDGVQISSMCAVFAESEVIGLVARGAKRQDIALAVHRAIAARASAMLGRVGVRAPAVFAGGAARNRCLAKLIGDIVDCELLVPHHPQMLGALGAALLAAETWSRQASGLPCLDGRSHSRIREAFSDSRKGFQNC